VEARHHDVQRIGPAQADLIPRLVADNLSQRRESTSAADIKPTLRRSRAYRGCGKRSETM
jgi:hypothetical protein